MGFFERRRQRAAAEQLAHDDKARAEGIELIDWMIGDARTNEGEDVPGFEERRGEVTFAVLEGVALIEPRREAGTYAGRSSGYSFHVMKGVNYRIGATKGRFVPGAEVPTPIDHGTAFVSNQRVVFRGATATREWAWSKLVSLDHDDHLPWTSLPVSNRQKTSGLLYDDEHRALVRFRLQQGLAHFQGKLDAFVTELEAQRADLVSAAQPRGGPSLA